MEQCNPKMCRPVHLQKPQFTPEAAQSSTTAFAANSVAMRVPEAAVQVGTHKIVTTCEFEHLYVVEFTKDVGKQKRPVDFDPTDLAIMEAANGRCERRERRNAVVSCAIRASSLRASGSCFLNRTMQLLHDMKKNEPTLRKELTKEPVTRIASARRTLIWLQGSEEENISHIAFCGEGPGIRVRANQIEQTKNNVRMGNGLLGVTIQSPNSRSASARREEAGHYRIWKTRVAVQSGYQATARRCISNLIW
ncbi:uncharacterized protein LAESUDRAFT_775794 [Laetiporus sulphureus 93-53]|uniref:Uncharacterized protein n=1 Tax=Laetiporus sulphureus 93-53 TaxID=1314785 RepID=A0A165HK89_9APHY|nr:uncharacterized protein LAESUDRAFT_775794 [Laetiporus sulphureus 93-53]KZT11839.1 hypothetical protein LAESUDRAFT_775794 [Laetiporus sulphureus 93-53]